MTATGQWSKTSHTYIWVFNVGRGLSVFARFPQNFGVIYDLGSSDEFSPAEFIENNIYPRLHSDASNVQRAFRIRQAVISHPHSDHIAEIDRVQDGKPLNPKLLTCPNDKIPDEKIDFNRIKNPDGTEELLEEYKKAYAKRGEGLQTMQSTDEQSIADCEYGIYYVRPPKCNEIHPSNDQDYGNAVSIALYLRYGAQSILIPGDITPDAFELILDDKKGIEKRYSCFWKDIGADCHKSSSGCPSLGGLLKERGLSILVAPHHGLESGYCDALYTHIRGGKPLLNVISEKRHLSETDGSVDARYQNATGATGLNVDDEGEVKSSYSVSTRNDQHILIVFKGDGGKPFVYLRNDPDDLLNIVP